MARKRGPHLIELTSSDESEDNDSNNGISDADLYGHAADGAVNSDDDMSDGVEVSLLALHNCMKEINKIKLLKNKMVKNALNYDQKKVLQNYGFGSLLTFDKCYVPSKFVKWVARSVDHKSGDIILDGKVIYLDNVDFGNRQPPDTIPRVLVWKQDMIKSYSDLDEKSHGVYGLRPLLDRSVTCYAKTLLKPRSLSLSNDSDFLDSLDIVFGCNLPNFLKMNICKLIESYSLNSALSIDLDLTALNPLPVQLKRIFSKLLNHISSVEDRAKNLVLDMLKLLNDSSNSSEKWHDLQENSVNEDNNTIPDNGEGDKESPVLGNIAPPDHASDDIQGCASQLIPELPVPNLTNAAITSTLAKLPNVDLQRVLRKLSKHSTSTANEATAHAPSELKSQPSMVPLRCNAESAFKNQTARKPFKDISNACNNEKSASFKDSGCSRRDVIYIDGDVEFVPDSLSPNPPSLQRRMFVPKENLLLDPEQANNAVLERDFSICSKTRPLSKSNLLFFPTCYDNHWFVFAVDIKDKNFVFLDPFYSKDDAFQEHVRDRMINSFMIQWDRYVGVDMKFDDYDVVYPNVPAHSEDNMCDSGIISMMCVEYWTSPRVMLSTIFSPSDVPNIRVKIANNLLFNSRNKGNKNLVIAYMDEAPPDHASDDIQGCASQLIPELPVPNLTNAAITSTLAKLPNVDLQKVLRKLSKHSTSTANEATAHAPSELKSQPSMVPLRCNAESAFKNQTARKPFKDISNACNNEKSASFKDSGCSRRDVIYIDGDVEFVPDSLSPNPPSLQRRMFVPKVTPGSDRFTPMLHQRTPIHMQNLDSSPDMAQKSNIEPNVVTPDVSILKESIPSKYRLSKENLLLDPEQANNAVLERGFSICSKTRPFSKSNLLFFPTCYDNHWFVFAVDIEDKNFVFLDPFYSKDDAFQEHVRDRMIYSFMIQWDRYVGVDMKFDDYDVVYPNV
ncbi:hypothetical protein EJB05_15140 [Eragrostis curvula]|uniref:Ubiquitin-like protease family profile domain-containing protein n=1 Tax=Eragrostis curvula TaxID=38414 RepID=A0A5J9W0E7_9POAL|nr:hypothetical protein EJB05_15140 [Eragrostis curvula]